MGWHGCADEDGNAYGHYDVVVVAFACDIAVGAVRTLLACRGCVLGWGFWGDGESFFEKMIFFRFSVSQNCFSFVILVYGQRKIDKYIHQRTAATATYGSQSAESR